MKFLVALALIALVSVAAARSKRNLELVFGGGPSPYANVLAREIAPLLLQRQPLINYQTVPLAAPAPIQVAAPQIYTIALPLQQQRQYAAAGPINAAVQSRHSVHFIDVPSSHGAAPTQSIVIGPSVQPLDLEFQSQSSPVSVRQVHIPGQPNPPQFSSHTDAPDLLKQEIIKPIIHEVTEAIQPFRKITQEVRPVQETINQVITRGQNVQTVAAPVAVQALPVAAAPVESVAAANIIAEPIPETVIQANPVAQQVFNGPFAAFNGQLHTVPVNARITRF